MRILGLCFLLLSLVALSYSQNPLQGTIDLKKLQGILEEGAKSKDIATLYYSLKGLKLLNVKTPDVCQEIKNFKYDLKNLEQIYYLTNAAALSGCVNFLNPEVMSTATHVLDNKNASIQELYQAIYSLKALGKGQPVDKDEALKNLIQLLKKDDSPAKENQTLPITDDSPVKEEQILPKEDDSPVKENQTLPKTDESPAKENLTLPKMGDSPADYGYVFGLCEHLGCESWTVSHAEGVLLAADESDGRALHFEGGLPTTSLVLTTIIRSYIALKKPTPLSEEQRYKFSEYLLSRRSVNTPRGAALLLEAARALADDQPTPISIAVKGRKYVTADSDSIQLTVSDILGRAVRGLKPEEVVAQSGTRLADDVVVLSKQPLAQKPGEPTTFVLNLSKVKSQHGLYKIAVSAGSKTANVNIVVLGEIQLGPLELGVADADGVSSPQVTTVTYPNRLAGELQADHMQNMVIKFSVHDKADRKVTVQQAFLRVAPEDDSQEAIFVAEPDSNKVYKVELTVSLLWKHLMSGSGVYSLSLYVGDSAVANPKAWHFANVHFNFGTYRQASGNEAGVKSTWAARGPRPEIEHMFRAAEPRPPRVVSDVFAAACAAPLLLLLALWAKLRVNLSNLPVSLSALFFHLSFGACLSLYGLLWLQLTMFETVRYLLPLALLVFLSGHRLLRRLATNKHK